MPEEGIDLSPEGKILTNEELLRLASLFVRNGVTKIRLTGGEPTVRKGIVDLIGKPARTHTRGDANEFYLAGQFNELKSIGLSSIAMTSNGLALHRKLPQMIDSGLSHLNLRCAFWIP